MMRILILILSLAVAVPAVATMKPPVDVNIETDPNHIPVQGEVLEVEFVFTTDTPITLMEPAIRSGRTPQGEDNWEVISFDMPPEVVLEPGAPRTYTASLVCNAPTEAMHVEYDIGSFSERKTFFLTPLVNNQAVESNDGLVLGNPGWDPTTLRPDPVPAPELAPYDRPGHPEKDSHVDLKDEEEGEASLSVLRTAVGNIRYLRPSDSGDIYSGADGVTVRLYDKDIGPDDLLGTVITDRWGNFVIDFVWIFNEDPDLYVEFEAGNGVVWIMYPSGVPAIYQWASATKYNETATTVNFGNLQPAADWQMPMLHACTQLSRAWVKLAEIGYGNLTRIKVRMPDSDWPHYKGGSIKTIYMSADRIWQDGTLWHEYGHHIVHEFGNGIGSDYCNSGSRCDYIDGDDSCRHCNWCEETPGDAWNEGFPSWFADVMTRVISDHYAVLSGEATDPYVYEMAGTCSVDLNGDGGYDDPYKTEGLLAALLRDLEDGGPADSDPLGGGIGKDKLNMTTTDIFHVMSTYIPTTPEQFLFYFALEHPDRMQDIWFTARNNGYNFDSTAPGLVGNLFSASHNAIPSPDATIEFTWDEPADDISGVGDYSVWIGLTPQAPDFIADGIGPVTSLVTDPLPPGIYWFSIRARDNAGNWSSDWALYGPLAIRDPLPANVYPATTAFYEEPVVPNQDVSPIYGIVEMPDFLPPDPGLTYLNLCIGNDGELPTDDDFTVHAFIDGVLSANPTVPASSPIDPGQFHYVQNQGPHAIRGGRHTLSIEVDAGESLAEPVETDNTDQRQWIWSPYLMVPGQSRLETPPPRPYAGWYEDPPLFTASNCVGTRMLAGSSHSAAMYLLPEDLDDDFSLFSHPVSTGPNNGFSIWFSEALSYRSEGLLDAVIVSPETVGNGAWDVGVVNHNGSGRQIQDDWRIRLIESEELPFSTPIQVDWDGSEAMSLFHSVYPSRLLPDQMIVEVIADETIGPLNVAVYPKDMDHAGLLDHAHYGRTGRLGTLEVSFEQSVGLWTIAVWRDPADQPDGQMPLEAASFAIELRPELPNLTPAQVAGWHAPLVPRPAEDGTPVSVPAPAVLNGYSNGTWLNAAVRNTSGDDVNDATTIFWLDGEVLSSKYHPEIPAYTTDTWNALSPVYVRGGRHTLSMRIDHSNSIVEEYEDDNVYGAQWAWIPTILNVDETTTRTAPADAVGGWEDVVDDGPLELSFNVDGFRTPVPQPSGDDGHWLAFAVGTHLLTEDVDLRLFEADDNAVYGFSDLQVSSIFGPGQSDYVLANFRATSARSFDVGVMNAGATFSYHATVTESQFLATDPVGTYGAFPMAAGELVHLHEIELTGGTLTVELTPTGGNLDWGMTLHRANLPLHSKNTPMDGGEAWANGPGLGEQMGLAIPEPGHYCLAVWKASGPSAGSPGEYQLTFGTLSGVDDVPEMVPRSTAISSIVPNPFNPQTEVRFSTAAEGHVRLAVYDIRGRHVATLVDEHRSVGRYEVQWDGRDDGGRELPSGVYFTRLQAAGEVDLGRMTLVR